MRPGCPLCQSQDTVDAFTKTGFQYHRCRTCSHIFVFPPPTERENAQYYSFIYSEHYLAQNWKWFELLGRRRMDIVNELPGDSGRLLDIGCGHGFFLKEAARRGWDGLGIEVSEEPRRFAQDKLGLHVIPEHIEQGLTKLEPNTFDLVTFWHVLEHLEEPGCLLREAIKRVKPGGHLIINSPNMGSAIRRIVGSLWSWIYTPGHLQYFSLASLSEWLEQQGFRVVKTDTWTDAPNLYFFIEEALFLRLREALERSKSPSLRVKGNRLSKYLNTPDDISFQSWALEDRKFYVKIYSDLSDAIARRIHPAEEKE